MGKKRIGFIGLGLMGHGAAKNILKNEYPLTVLGHRNREPVENLLAGGAEEAASPTALAGASDIVLTCVSSSAVVEALVFGPQGLLEGAREGQILVDMTTADPNSTARVAEALAEKGVRMLDAAMTRTPKEAEEGRLNLVVGGDAAVLNEVRAVLETFTENIFHVGALGAGHKLKLINNFLGLGTAALAAEAAATAKMVGVDVEKFYEVVSAGGADSRMFQMLMPYPLQGDAGGLQFSIRNALKDYGYFVEMTHAAGMVPLTGAAVYQTYALAAALGFGDEHIPMLYDLIMRLASGAEQKE